MQQKLLDESQLQEPSAALPCMPVWTAAATLRKRGGNPFDRWTERYWHLSASGEFLTTRESMKAPVRKTYKVAEVRAHPSARRRLIFVLKDGGEVHAEADTDIEAASFVCVAGAAAISAYTAKL